MAKIAHTQDRTATAHPAELKEDRRSRIAARRSPVLGQKIGGGFMVARIERAHASRTEPRRGLRLWLVCRRSRPVMMPGYWSRRKAIRDAKALASRGLTVQIRQGRQLLRELRPFLSAVAS